MNIVFPARAGLKLTVILSGVEGYLIHFSTNPTPLLNDINFQFLSSRLDNIPQKI